MRRLATQIHLTIVAVLVLFAILAGAAWFHGPGIREEEQLADGARGDASRELLPPPGSRRRRSCRPLSTGSPSRFGMDAAVFAPDGRAARVVGRTAAAAAWRRARARTSSERARPRAEPRPAPARRPARGRRPAPPRPAPPRRRWPSRSACSPSRSRVGAWPLVRRLTRRLENLRRRVEDLGGGDLGARAPVEGRDEVADLARSFNRAADRIQALVEAQRRQLAFASHELRSPLARLRVSLEMMTGDPALKERAARDVAELDGLIDELLEASRLEAQRGPGRVEDVDLLALVAEEAARGGAEAEGEPVVLRGDPRLLRRLVRNLLDNARRHGGGAPVEAHVDARRAAGRASR